MLVLPKHSFGTPTSPGIEASRGIFAGQTRVRFLGCASCACVAEAELRHSKRQGVDHPRRPDWASLLIVAERLCEGYASFHKA